MGDTLDPRLASVDPALLLATWTGRWGDVVRTASLADVRHALRVVGAGDRAIPAALAWRAGYLLHQNGRYAEALAATGRAVVDDADPADLAQLHAARASAEWAQGDADGCQRDADLALALAERSGDPSAQAAAWVAQASWQALIGDRHANRRAYGRALAAARRAGDVTTEVRVLSNLASYDAEEGRPAVALETLDRALALDEELSGMARVLVSVNRGEALVVLGRLEEAIIEFEAARTICRDADSPMLAFALLGLGDTHRIRGSAGRAAAFYREALEVAEATSNAQILLPALGGLARVTVADDLATARSLVKRALDLPASLGHVGARLSAGWVALADGRTEAAADHARAAELEAGHRHDSQGLAEALMLEALAEPGPHPDNRLVEAASIWEEIGNPIATAKARAVMARRAADRTAESVARRGLRRLGVLDGVSRIAGPLHVLAAAGSGVEIRTLGGFTVTLEGHHLPPSVWRSHKSRDVLKILAGRHGRPIRREELRELLWPGVPDTGSRLSVALSTLRGVLDPGKHHPADRFLCADRSRVWLNIEAVEIDVAIFEHLARTALASPAADPRTIDRLEQAAAACPGPFLPDDEDDWAARTRDEVAGLAVEVRRALATRLSASSAPERAITWLAGLVAEDPYDEDSYVRLIAALSRARRHGEARRHYRGYVARMAELGAPALSWEQAVGAG